MMLRATVFAAMTILGCEVFPALPQQLIGNPTTCSANGRYCVVVQQYPRIGDFEKLPAGKVLTDLWEYGGPPQRNPLPAAVYELAPGGAPHRVARVKLETRSLGQVLVSDSGHYLIATRPRAVCYDVVRATDPLFTIYTMSGERVAAVTAGELFDASDLEEMNRLGLPILSLKLGYRHGREVAIATNSPTLERMIDVATGRPVDAHK